MMPGLDGPGTLLRIRSIGRFVGTPVTFMTVKALPAKVDRFKSLGAIAVIAKPFDPMQLANQVIAVWEGCAHV
jgi:two-component system, OmpR family, response regulator